MTTTNPIDAKITITNLNLLPETLRAMAKQAAGRRRISADTQPFESKASKSNTIKISSIGYTSHAQARSNARLGGDSSSSAHVDAMAAAGWLA